MADAQTLVDGLAYENSSDDPTTANRVVTLTSIQDSGGTLNGGVDTTALAIASTVSITAVNDAPVIDLDADNSTASGLDYRTNFVDGGAAVSIVDTDLVLADAESDLQSITVTITNVFESGGKEILAASAGSTGLIITFDPSPTPTTAVLTITGPGTLANFKSVLDTVTYQNTQNNPDTTTRAITFTAYDGSDTNVVATTYVSVFLVGGGTNAPVATGNTVDTPEDTALTFSSADFTFVDVDFDPLVSATIKNLSLAFGTLTYAGGTTVNEDDVLTAAQLDTLVYTPAANANGVSLASFDYAVNDAVDSGVDFAQMSIDVTAVNDAPTVTPIGNTVTEDTPAFADDLLTDASANDLDGDAVTMSGTPTITATGDSTDAGGVTVTGSTVSIDPNYYTGLAVGEQVVVVVNYNVTDGTDIVANTATYTINGADDTPTMPRRSSAAALAET